MLIKFYGATNTEIVKSLRKVLSIALSFLIYPKPVNAKYAAGMVATVASLVINFRLKRRKHVRVYLFACSLCDALTRMLRCCTPATDDSTCCHSACACISRRSRHCGINIINCAS